MKSSDSKGIKNRFKSNSKELVNQELIKTSISNTPPPPTSSTPIRLVIGKEAIDVKLRECIEASVLGIRVSRLGIVELFMPKTEDLSEGLQFLEQRKLWIKEQLDDIEKSRQIALEQGVPKKIHIFAKQYNVVLDVIGLDEAIEIKGNKLLVSHLLVNDQEVLYVIAIYLQSIIESEASIYVNMLAQKLELEYGKIYLREASKEIGYHIANDLYFSWRLVFAPRYVLYGLISKELLKFNKFSEQSKYHQNLNLRAEMREGYNLAKNWLKKNSKSLDEVFGGNTERVISKNRPIS